MDRIVQKERERERDRERKAEIQRLGGKERKEVCQVY